MSYKSSINDQIRGFNFSTSGTDTEADGTTAERAFRTITKALTSAAALSPPPSQINTAQIVASQPGTFNESITMEDFVTLLGSGVVLINSDSVSVEISSSAACTLDTVINAGASNTAININGKNLAFVDIPFLQTSGANGTALNITGAVSDISCDFDRVVASGDGGTAINIVSTQTNPIKINVGTMGLDANNTTFVDYNPPNATDEAVVRVSAIKNDSFTGTTAFLAQGGSLAIESSGLLKADTILRVQSGNSTRFTGTNIIGGIIVETGGTLECSLVCLTGDITVESGATLSGTIAAHTGTITNDGTIRGFIDNIAYSDEITFQFKNTAARDSFFSVNLSLLTTELLIEVKTGNSVTLFEWTGATNPSTYDNELWIESSLNVGPGTLFLGADGSNISSAGKGLNVNSAYGDASLAIGNFFDTGGSTKRFDFEFNKELTFTNADVFDTQLSPGAQQDFNFASVGNTYTQGLNIRPATAGTLRVRGYAGTDNTFPILEDTRVTIIGGDIGNIVTVPVTGILVVPDTDLFLTFTGIDLFGGVQTSGDFSGQTKAFLQSELHALTPATILNKTDLDQYALLNSDYTTTSVKTGGIVINSLPTATTDTFATATFIEGVASTSNPSVPTVGTGIFSAGEIVLITHTSPFAEPSDNDGIYEVLTHISNVLTIKGIGTTATVEDFTKDQFVSQESSGTITKTSVSVLRGTDTTFEAAFGSSTPFVFNNIDDTPGGSDTQLQYNNSGAFGGITGVTTSGSNLRFDANVLIEMGTTSDLNIYHAVTAGVIDNNVGSLDFRNFAAAAGDINIHNEGATNSIITKLGTATSATKFTVNDSADVDLFNVSGEGNVNIGSDITYQKSVTNLRFNDDVSASFGTGDDLVIFHDGSKSSITNNLGNLEITNGTGGDLLLRSTSTSNKVIAKLGTATSATAFEVHDSADSPLFRFGGDGELTLFKGEVFTPVDTAGVDLDIVLGNGTAGTGGGFTVTAGNGGGGSFAGGSILLDAGNSDQVGRGGDARLTAGNGDTVGDGGSLTLSAGNAGNVSGGDGGPVTITAGDATAAFQPGGDIDITAGNTAGFSGAAGDIRITAGDATHTGSSPIAGKITLQTGEELSGTVTRGDLTMNALGGMVGIGATPTSTLYISENNALTGATGGVTIEQLGAGAAGLHFTNLNNDFTVGLDSSDGDFRISNGFSVEAIAGITIDTSDRVSIGNATPATTSQFDVRSTTRGSRPAPPMTEAQLNAIVTPADGLQAYDTTNKIMRYFDNTEWRAASDPPNVIKISTQQDWDNLSGSSLITVSVNTTFDIRTSITTDKRINVVGAIEFSILGSKVAGTAVNYTDGGTFITADGVRILRLDGVNAFDGDGTGTFFDVKNGAVIVEFSSTGLFNWSDMGTLTDCAQFRVPTAGFFFNGAGLKLKGVLRTFLKEIAGANIVSSSGPFFLLNNTAKTQTINATISENTITVQSDESILCLEPDLGDSSRIEVSGVITVGAGELFESTGGSTGTFTAVADAAVPAESITSVTDSSGIARFNFTAPPTLFVNQEVVISTFVTNTAYNGTFIITATGANFFESSAIDFGSDETGSFLSNSVTLTDTTTTLSDGDTLVIDTTLSTDYDGGATVYNQLTNSFQINSTFVATEAGAWDTGPINETDPRVLSVGNPGAQDSQIIGFGEVNANATATTATDGVYAAIDVSGFANNLITERLKLIDATAGIYEFTGTQDCPCFVTSPIWATKTGSTANYRFAVSLNGAVPVFASAPYTPMEVKTTKVGTIVIEPVELTIGDTIQIMLAGDGTGDNPTITDFKLEIK